MVEKGLYRELGGSEMSQVRQCITALLFAVQTCSYCQKGWCCQKPKRRIWGRNRGGLLQVWTGILSEQLSLAWCCLLLSLAGPFAWRCWLLLTGFPTPSRRSREQGFGGHTKTLGEGSSEGRFLSVPSSCFGNLRTPSGLHNHRC